jgi:ABC-type amino acid transport substrate-binding protein
MTMKIILCAMVVLCLIVGVGYFMVNQSANNTDDMKATGKLSEILKKGEIVIGVDATYAPLEFKDEAGNFAGLDVDFGNELARRLGVKAVFKNVAWNDLFTSINNDSIDISDSSITITAERAKTLGFSDPYFNAGQVIVSTTSASSYIKGPENLRRLRVGAQVNTTSDTEVRKYVASSSQVFNFETYAPAETDLISGKLDAIVIDRPAGASMTSKDKRLALMGDIFTSEFYGVVTKKGEHDLLLKINKLIREMKQDGTLTNLENKWLK